jgi:Spy/CpxP family protein refolding chaperone
VGQEIEPMTKSKKTILFAAGTLVLAISASSLAFARGGHGGCGGGGGGMLGGPVLHALNLSADQQQSVRSIRSAHRSTLRQLAANERAARQALTDRMLASGTLTQQDLDGLMQQEAQARAALAHERMATALEVRSVLIADQLQKAATIRTSMKQLHTQMRQLYQGQSTD